MIDMVKSLMYNDLSDQEKGFIMNQYQATIGTYLLAEVESEGFANGIRGLDQMVDEAIKGYTIYIDGLASYQYDRGTRKLAPIR